MNELHELISAGGGGEWWWWWAETCITKGTLFLDVESKSLV